MRIAYYLDSFDPITEKQFQFANSLLKSKIYDVLVFVVAENGLVDQQDRFRMVKLVAKPYRKMKVMLRQDLKEEQFITFREDVDYFTLNKKIKRYIMEHGLYLKEIIKVRLKEKRYLHCLSVADLCCEIAKRHHLDSYKAYMIGILHDFCKYMDENESSIYMNIYKPYEINYPYPVHHTYTSYYYLKHHMYLYDKVILKAIRHHCLGDDNDVYSKIVFIADKLDPSRGYDSSKTIELAYRNIDLAFIEVQKQRDGYLSV